MDVYQLNLCGFEKEYMTRLSLFLKKRMGEQMLISVWDNIPDDIAFTDEKKGRVTIWLGGKEEICRIKDVFKRYGDNARKPSDLHICFLSLSDQKTADRPDEIFAFQSANAILEFILGQAQKLSTANGSGGALHLQVDLLIDIGEKRSLLSCGVAYAQELGADQRVLLLDLIPCSGLTGLFELPVPERDFADLILSLRRDDAETFTDAIIHAGNIDILPAACNPVVLYELSEKDMKLLLEQIVSAGRYETAVVMSGTPFPGIRQLFLSAAHVICLQDEGVYSASRRKEVFQYFCYAGGDKDRWKDVVLQHGAEGETNSTGMHLLFEWGNSSLAKQLWQETET